MELKDLRPQILWKHFLDLTRIPRPSGKEGEVRKHIISWAKDKNFEHKEDKAGNLVIKVPAKKGYEKSPAVVLQGHLDMVAEKNSDSKVDPNKDPLDVYEEEDWLKARGTTLGADNGIGVAAGMAIADDPDSRHGPLELLCTVDEETAMTGAFALDSSFVKGRKLINLDTEELGAFYVGCAGGEDTSFIIKGNFESPAEGFASYSVKVSGLKGGHSGLDIDKGRGNANKILASALASMQEKTHYRLAYIQGGNKRNALPREAKAHVIVSEDRTEDIRKSIDQTAEKFKKELSRTDPDLKISFEKEDKYPKKVISEQAQKDLLSLLNETPNGIIAMSKDIEGLVETSTNLGVINTKEDAMEIVNCKRSSSDEAMKILREKFHALAKKLGADATESSAYPGWKPNMGSELLKLGKAAWKEKFGNDPEVKAIHAGLECGIIGEKYQGMDMISIGPDIKSAHSPDESLGISSTRKFYEFLKFYLVKLT